MRRSNWTPSIVPRGDDHDVYLVVDDLGIGVIALNSAEGCARDMSADAAIEIRKRCDLQPRGVPSVLQDFVDRYDAIDRSQLPLPLRLV